MRRGRRWGNRILACCAWCEGRECVRIMPPGARWEYDNDRECGHEVTSEAEMVMVLNKPRSRED